MTPRFAAGQSGWSRGRIRHDSGDGFGDYRDLPGVNGGLVKGGYSDEQIRRILGEKFLRVFEGVCD